jgi:hypothetical protein
MNTEAFVAVFCTLLRETEKAILVSRRQKTYWLAKSQVHYQGKGRIFVDVPMWLARKNRFPVSYRATTLQGQEHNQHLGFTNYLDAEMDREVGLPFT